VLFDEDHERFRAAVRKILEREVAPHVEEWEAAGSFPAHELFPVLGAAGLLGLEYDPRYGGQGADHSYTVVLGEELGRIDCGGVPMAIAVQTDMATPALHRFGSEELKQRYLAPAIRGEMVAAIAVTEPDAGSDVAALRTRAVRDGDEWVVTGTKLYITNGTQADWLCLLARTSDEGGHRGMSQIVFPTDTPGFSVSRKLDKLGNRSSDTAELSFDEARVPVANTIGEVGRGFQQQMAQFQNERLIAAYMAVGAMELALERTAAYLRERTVFGRPLIDSPYVQFRLAELRAELEMLRSHNYACAASRVRGEDVTPGATVAKLKAGRLSRQVADTCLQLHGGVGYMEETWVSRYFRDSRLLSIGGGADEVMLAILARLYGYGSGA
jgi:citronellyl-CoA dehydrogenase